jgi:hypothetical protein
MRINDNILNPVDPHVRYPLGNVYGYWISIPTKNIHGYLFIYITVPADTKFYHTHIQWIIIRDYLSIPVPIAIHILGLGEGD